MKPIINITNDKTKTGAISLICLIKNLYINFEKFFTKPFSFGLFYDIIYNENIFSIFKAWT